MFMKGQNLICLPTSEKSQNHKFWNCSTCQLVNSDNQNDLAISKLLENAIYRKRNFKAIRKQKTYFAKIKRQVNSSLALSYCHTTTPKYQQGSAVKTIYISSRTGEVVRKLVLVF